MFRVKETKLITDPAELRLTVDPAPPKIYVATPEELAETRPEVKFVLPTILDVSRWTATDEADVFKNEENQVAELPERSGRATIPVLTFLNGRAWNNAALNVVHSLRPSAIRVTSAKISYAECYPWRVTVHLAEDGRTIRKVVQEVKVGLIGSRYGADVEDYVEGRVPSVGVPIVG